ncbi:MAG: hypothetical protein KDD63_10450, partial [Bacteroidetes bacterium]|nr:hypothetical protein [Bacteroidota bacterium]
KKGCPYLTESTAKNPFSMKNPFIFLLFACLSHSLYGQKLDWFALNDCADFINPQFLEVDTAGNSYIIGKFKGETFFHSATPEGPKHHTYTSSSWQRTFLLKYDSAGNLLYFINMYGTSSNGNYADPRAFIMLSDGRLALAAYTENGIYTRDATGSEQTIRGNDEMMLLVFSTEGKLLSGTPLGLKNTSKMIEDSVGNLYFAGVKKSYSREIPAVFLLKKGEKELLRLPAPDSAVIDIELKNEKLWFLTSDESTGRFRSGSQSFSLYELTSSEAGQSYLRHFTKTFNGHHNATVSLLNQSGDIEVLLQITKQEKAVLTLSDNPVNHFKQNGIFLFQHNGNIKSHLDLDNVHGNLFRLQSRKNGGYLASAFARENIYLGGKDSIVVQPQPDYYWEKFVLIFDSSLKLERYSSLGSSNSDYYQCNPQEVKGKLYFSAILVNFGHFGGVYKELNWKAGFYVARFGGLVD